MCIYRSEFFQLCFDISDTTHYLSDLNLVPQQGSSGLGVALGKEKTQCLGLSMS